MKNLAIIPARIGSKRIIKKNIKLFFGKPVIYYAIECAINSGLFTNVIVSTDSIEIKKIALKYKAEVPYLRKKKLSNDTADTDSVVLDVINYYISKNISFNYVCCIYPVTPLLGTFDLKKGLKKLIKYKGTTLFPIYESVNDIHRKININSAGFMNYKKVINKKNYNDAGQFYWINVNKYIKSKKIWSKKSIPLYYTRKQLIDVNTLEDWEKLKLIYKKSNIRKTN